MNLNSDTDTDTNRNDSEQDDNDGKSSKTFLLDVIGIGFSRSHVLVWFDESFFGVPRTGFWRCFVESKLRANPIGCLHGQVVSQSHVRSKGQELASPVVRPRPHRPRA